MILSLQRELTEAKKQQSLLASQVERERAEVERLKLRKQQNIAYEAAIKVGTIILEFNLKSLSPCAKIKRDSLWADTNSLYVIVKLNKLHSGRTGALIISILRIILNTEPRFYKL